MRQILLALALASCAGCSQLSGVVRYTDELTDADTGRTWAVRGPASLGGMIGFIVGIPVDIVGVPVTWSVWRYKEAQMPEEEPELAAHLLFPSFVLWRAGTLLGAPFDLVEWGIWRSWQPQKSMTEEERRDIEIRIDEETLPRYPVRPIYPLSEKSG